MYKKSYRTILIALILNFINEILANDQVTKHLLNLTDAQIATLSDMVCYDLSEILDNKMKPEECLEQYQRTAIKNAISTQPSDLEIKCQTNATSTFEVKPSGHRKLVVLVEQSKQPSNFVPYILMGPNDQFSKIKYYSPNVVYSIWVATLADDGRPLQWMKGPYIRPYNQTSEYKKYNVTIYDAEIVQKGDTFIARTIFTWNRTDTDMCYDIPYVCRDHPLKVRKLWPTKNPMLVLDLPVDVTCTMNVIGKYGSTPFNYRTLSCADSEECKKRNKKPWAPEFVDVQTGEYDSNSWLIRVNWTQPRLLPQKYRVTLWTADNASMIVDGNVTEAIFKDVVAEGPFYVTVDAIILDWAQRTSRLIILPVASGSADWAWWWGASGAWVLLLAAATVGGACLACRRPKPPDKDPLYPELKEKIKEFDIEAFGSGTGGTEDQWEVRMERLAVHEVVGEGAFGVVRRGTLTPHNKEVAVKMLKDFPTLDEIRSFRAEMELMKSVGTHPHIVSLVGCCTGKRPLIVTEYCSRGDLLSYLRCSWDVMISKRNAKYYNNNIDSADYRNNLYKSKLQRENSRLVVNKLYDLQGICDVELTALDLLSFCRQIAMGMEFLASNKVVHRDLAARNILVTGDRTLKIADFGLSRDVYEDNQYKQKGNGKLPVKWMALESLTRKIYTTQSDVWSFGVVIWEVVTMGGSPYPEVPASRLLRLLRAGYRMPRPVNCSKQLYELMSSCWRAYPRERPTFSELHQRLDELLNCACADEYLTLEIESDDAPPTPKSHRYLKMFTKGKRYLTRGESYERPLNPPQSNHYSSPPDILGKTPV